jgi:cobalt/nickel transport system ATP-binding protein
MALGRKSVISLSRPPSAQIDAAFDLRGVEFRYSDGHLALESVDLLISRGERVGLLGANGSGKSTLLRILNGLQTATSGTMRAFDDRIDESSLRDGRIAGRFRRNVGFVFQNSDAQLFSSTVREEIAFGPLHSALPPAEIEQRTVDVAAMLGIGHLLERPPFRLSGGEKKKVAIASVLVMNPEAILLDEPTSGLDPRSRGWVVEILQTLHDVGKTLVIATHDLDLARAVADRVVVLGEDHRIHADGLTPAILRQSDLLTRVNLIHEHYHWHGTYGHSHPHHHGGDHEHAHEHTHENDDVLGP